MSQPSPDTEKNARCRLCHGLVRNRFGLKVLGKYDVAYGECVECGSLQTEPPYWLDEAYKNNLSGSDTGAAQRNLENFIATFVVCKLFALTNAVDFGGGDGFLCRLLRDYNINCFVEDKFADPVYAQGFTEPDFDSPDLVTGFEVLEHLPDPEKDVVRLFGHGAPVVFVSTEIYSEQGTDWWYLSPDTGQHIFFYSRKALELIAERFGYESKLAGSYILFVKNGRHSQLRLAIARLFLRRRICKLLRAVVFLLPASGVSRDHRR